MDPTRFRGLGSSPATILVPMMRHWVERPIRFVVPGIGVAAFARL
jgi:hypothetical protein